MNDRKTATDAERRVVRGDVMWRYSSGGGDPYSAGHLRATPYRIEPWRARAGRPWGIRVMGRQRTWICDARWERPVPGMRRARTMSRMIERPAGGALREPVPARPQQPCVVSGWLRR